MGCHACMKRTARLVGEDVNPAAFHEAEGASEARIAPPLVVTPALAGVSGEEAATLLDEMPAFAGMTNRWMGWAAALLAGMPAYTGMTNFECPRQAVILAGVPWTRSLARSKGMGRPKR